MKLGEEREVQLDNYINNIIPNYESIILNNSTILTSLWDFEFNCKYANRKFLKCLNTNHLNQVNSSKLISLLDKSDYILQDLIEDIKFGKTFKATNHFNCEFKLNLSCIITIMPYYILDKIEGFILEILPFEVDLNTLNGAVNFSKEKMLIDKVAKYIKDNIFEPFVGIQNLSEMYFISAAKLKRDFKQKFNTSPFAYYRYHQMIYADHQLINNNATKKELALQLNFSNVSNFYICYKKFKSTGSIKL